MVALAVIDRSFYLGDQEMAKKTFSVTRYVYQVGYKNTATWGGTHILIQGYVACYGDSDRFIVYGLHPDSPVPASPVYNVSGNVGAIFVPFAELSNYVDIVRNEKPVYATLNSDRPEWMGLRTSSEPTGEEES
jgi:hypothetical protein